MTMRIFPFVLRCAFALSKNSSKISFPSTPPVVVSKAASACTPEPVPISSTLPETSFSTHFFNRSESSRGSYIIRKRVIKKFIKHWFKKKYMLKNIDRLLDHILEDYNKWGICLQKRPKLHVVEERTQSNFNYGSYVHAAVILNPNQKIKRDYDMMYRIAKVVYEGT